MTLFTKVFILAVCAMAVECTFPMGYGMGMGGGMGGMGGGMGGMGGGMGGMGIYDPMYMMGYPGYGMMGYKEEDDKKDKAEVPLLPSELLKPEIKEGIAAAEEAVQESARAPEGEKKRYKRTSVYTYK